MNSVLPGNLIFSPNRYRTGFNAYILGIKAVSKAFFFFFCLIGGVAKAQTDFAPGEIMFVGYEGFGTNDTFSFVLLTDVLANTVIFITDRGWSNTTGFRTGTIGTEGIISFTFNS